MTTIAEVEQERGTWLFVAPIQNLIIRKDVNFEYRVDKVCFVDAKHFPLRRKRFGVPYRIGELKKKHHFIGDFFNGENTFATMRLTGNGDKLKDKFLKTVRDELAILALSQLGYSQRKNNSNPILAYNIKPSLLSYLLINISPKKWALRNESLDKVNKLILEFRWNDFQNKFFFKDLIKIIRRETCVKTSWIKTIKNAAILAGQSQCSSDLPKCFLWNMIAIEMLLTEQGDNYTEALPERAEAFIGWTTKWKLSDYDNKIKQVYKKRCGLVHAGKLDNIKEEDLLFTDEILINILSNIIRHPEIFTNKEKLINFSEKIKAEHLLDIKPRVTPKSFKFINTNYEEGL